MSTTTSDRPFGVTVLAILAGIAGFLALIHVFQALALLPYFIGPFAVLGFSLWAALMWGLMVWVWFWLTRMLWDMDPQAWVFLVVITTFNLVLDFTYLIGRAEWNDISLNFLVNALILVYCILPNVRRAFGQGTLLEGGSPPRENFDTQAAAPEDVKIAGWFELSESANGQFHFVLKAGNAETILTSEMYTTKNAAQNGIASIQTNSPIEDRYERLEAKNGKYYFNLKAANHQIIGTSQMYQTAEARDKGIASVMTNGPTDNIKDSA